MIVIFNLAIPGGNLNLIIKEGYGILEMIKLLKDG